MGTKKRSLTRAERIGRTGKRLESAGNVATLAGLSGAGGYGAARFFSTRGRHGGLKDLAEATAEAIGGGKLVRGMVLKRAARIGERKITGRARLLALRLAKERPGLRRRLSTLAAAGRRVGVRKLSMRAIRYGGLVGMLGTGMRGYGWVKGKLGRKT